jgi:hypothetical protein
VTTARTVLTIAGLTLREAFRRRVLLALVALTAVLLALSGWGFSRLAAESGGTLTSGEARLTASIVLNLVMFGFSLIAALGTGVPGRTDARRRDRVRHRAVGAGPPHPALGVPARQDPRAGRLRQRLRGRGGAGAVPGRVRDGGLLAARAGDRRSRCSRRRRPCC